MYSGLFLTQNGLFETVNIICIRSVQEGICHFSGGTFRWLINVDVANRTNG
jgi:hypothetical protein